MRAGSKKYRTIMARLDEAGITANIVRVGKGWYELHVNFRIVKAAKSRNTCNRHLVQLLDSFYPPPLQLSDTLKLQILMFFQQLLELDPKLDLQFRAMAKDDQITVSVTPNNLKNVRPLLITGTAAELDAGLIDAIRQPVQVIGGLTVSNAAEFQEDVTKESGASAKPAATTKPGRGKTAAETAKPAAVPKEQPKEQPATDKQPEAAPSEETNGEKAVESAEAPPTVTTAAADALAPASAPPPPPPAPPRPVPPRPAAPSDQLFNQ